MEHLEFLESPEGSQPGYGGRLGLPVHPALRELFRRLRALRLDAGLMAEEVEQSLVLGPGWVERFESGEYELSIGMLVTLVGLYGGDLSSFFSGIKLGNDTLFLDRHLVATPDDLDLELYFPMGPHDASVTIPHAELNEFNGVLRVLRDELAAGHRREAIVKAFLEAVRTWPDSNPSDLWYFLVSHAYQDSYNHPATEAGRDWSQSWKRAAGWAFESIILAHYNPHLASEGIRLAMPAPNERERFLAEMGIPNPRQASQKADVIALGKKRGSKEEGFGVIHIKASFAERRTDDVPLSQQLLARGFASPLVTMDCKATPSARPFNRGELGAVQGGKEAVSPKRFDIERDNNFGACFSYNSNTKPTPIGQAAAARIYVSDFRDPDDLFSAHLVKKWRQRQGFD